MDYNFHINDFEGPLDLLLHLVKQSKMDIYEINLKEIIDQYLNIINNFESLNIDIASSYLVMAAELVNLKARLLVNRKDEEDTADEYSITSEEDLRNKLIEYEEIKNITNTFKDLEEKRSEVFTKVPENLKIYAKDNKLTKGLFTTDDLYQAFLEYQKRAKFLKPLNTKITKKELSIEDRITSIKKIIQNKKRVEFFSLFDTINREYIVVTFLAILQMSKNKELKIFQENSYSPIIVEGVLNEGR